MKFVILHGTGGTPEVNWFPWLAKELEKLGHQTVRPQLPTPEGQTPESWIAKIAETVDSLGGPSQEIVFVAHSMSPMAVCHYLATIPSSVAASYFVAGFDKFDDGAEEPYATVNPPFCNKPIDWTRVRQNCGKFVCFAGDNDPYVPLEDARQFAKHCGAELIVVPDGGHLSASTGYTEFPKLLAKITSTT